MTRRNWSWPSNLAWVKMDAFSAVFGPFLTHGPLKSLMKLAAFQADDGGSIPLTRSIRILNRLAATDIEQLILYGNVAPQCLRRAVCTERPAFLKHSGPHVCTQSCRDLPSTSALRSSADVLYILVKAAGDASRRSEGVYSVGSWPKAPPEIDIDGLPIEGRL